MNNGEDVLYSVDRSVGIITLNRPPENYLSVPEFIPLPLFREWVSDESLKGLIIRGSGRNFSAGGDLDRIFSAADTPPALEKLVEGGHGLLKFIEELEIPVIAAIERICFGGGLEIALACHFRVASENALLAFPEVNRNLMPGMGGTCRLPAAVGRFHAACMILGGDTVNAETAKSLGLIDHITPKDHAFDSAMNLMQRMTHDRPVKVIRYIMKALKNAGALDPVEAIQEETRMFCDLARDEVERRKNEHGE